MAPARLLLLFLFLLFLLLFLASSLWRGGFKSRDCGICGKFHGRNWECDG
jgi:hypothetical protein